MPLTSWRPTERRRVPCARCVCAPKWPRHEDVRLLGAGALGRGRACGYSGPGAAARPLGAGVGRRDRRGDPRRRRGPAAQVVAGWGPPEDLVEVAAWASWRWAGPVSFFLHAASPSAVVRALPDPPARGARPSTGTPAARHRPRSGIGRSTRSGPTMVRLPPATDLIDLVLSVVHDPGVRARGGSVVVLVPSTGWAERLTARLVRRGCPATGAWDAARAGWPVVVGSRAGAWAPVPRLAAAIVLDAHDAAYREESAPTYSAVDVLLERARRQAVPCILVSPVPPVALATEDGGRALAPSSAGSAPVGRRWSGWTAVERTPALECSRRSSSASPAPSSTTPPPRHGGRWCASTTAPAAPACWPAATVASWPGVRAAARPRPGPRRGGAAAARAAAIRGRSSARPVAGCA